MSKCSSIFIRWAKLVAHIFRMALARCTFTVTSLNPSSAAICLFRFPAATLAILKVFPYCRVPLLHFSAGTIPFQGRENRIQ